VFHRKSIFVWLAVCWPGPVMAQLITPFSCTTTLEAPTTVRAEGVAEQLNDLVITCTGGTPTPSGVAVPMANFQIFLNGNVRISNRLDANGYSLDALLIIDEPHSVTNPSVPLLACTGRCTIYGTGTGTGTYNGAAGRPNVFPGYGPGVTNSVIWSNVPLDAPGQGATRTFRITNVRANATTVSLASGNQVSAYLAINGSQQVTISNPTLTLSLVQPSLNASLTTANLSLCSPANPTIAADPTKPLDSGGQNGAQFSITLSEAFANAFRAKNTAQSIANAPNGGVFPAPAYAIDVNQNIPGFVYNTETGLFNYGQDPVPAVTNPAIPFTANFPAVDGLALAGVATQGTRLFVQLSGVPSGMQFFVPVQIPLLPTYASNLNQRTGTAVLVSTDATGAGAYSPARGNASGLAPMQISGTTALAVYELIYADPAHNEAITVPIAAAFGSGQLASVPQGAITVVTGYAPISSNAGSGDATVPVPRFSSAANSQTAFSVDNCGPDLVVAATHSGNLVTGGSGVLSLVVKDLGGVASSGTVTVADTLPAGLTATAIGGPGWTCSLSNLNCTRSDALNIGVPYAAVNINVTVAANAAASVMNSAVVSGGGDVNTANNAAADTIQITPLDTITIGTNLPGLGFSVDGNGYTSTQSFQWAMGTSHTVGADAVQVLAGTQYAFNNWSDAMAQYHSISVGAAGATYTVTYLPVAAGGILCTASAGNPPIVRAEGRAELIGDIILLCTGGTPTPAGVEIPKVDFQLTLNTNETNRLFATNYSEALLLVDEPHSGGLAVGAETNNLLACGAAGSNDDGTGVCTITSTGQPSTNYDASPGHPNVFQAQVGAANQLIWKQVPFDPPGSGTRVLRITNARADVAAVSLPVTSTQVVITGTLTALPGGIAIQNTQLTLGYSQFSLAAPIAAPAGLSPCAVANAAIAASASANLGNDGQNGAQFSIKLTEEFPTSFSVKNYAQYESNLAYTTLYPADVNQNVPGYGYNTLTGFFNGSAADPTYPNLFEYGSTPEFPSTRGLNKAGSADSGTRVYLRFTGVPAGVQLFVPVQLVFSSVNSAGEDGVAVLTATDANGAGAYAPVTGSAAQLAPVAIANGAGMAVYEVLMAQAVLTESITIPVAAAYLTPLTSPSTITVEYGLAPLSTVGTADATSPIPRFIDLNNTTPAFTFGSCSYTAPLTLTYSVTDNGKQDVSVYYPGQGGYQYSLESTGTGTYNPVPNSGIGSFDTVLQGDFNGDGKADMLFYNGATGAFKAGLGDGTGKFAYSPTIMLSAGFNVIARGDFNRDGKTDLLLYRKSDGLATIALSNGDGTFTYIGQTFSPGFTSVAVGDYNGDGISDVIVYNNQTSPYVAYYLQGDGTGHFVSGTGLFFGGGYNVYPADLNGDGKSDFILYRPNDGTVYVATSNGTSFSYHYLLYSPGFTAFKIGDVNGDGIPDLVLYNNVNANGYLLLGDGQGNFPTGYSLFFGPGMDFVDLRDFNGDGKQDVIIYRSSDGTSFTGISNGIGFNYTYNYFGPGRLIAN